MKLTLSLPFTLTTWEGQADPSPPDAPDLTAIVLAKKYAGDDVDAIATGHAVTTRGDLGASYVAQERIVGTVQGREGSFILEHGASMGDGVETVQWARVVAGSGTGELAGITGTGWVEHELLTLEADLPDVPAG